MKIALLIGRAIRDTPGAALLAISLCARGHTVYVLGGSRKGRRDVWALAPDLVILDGHRSGEIPFARELIEAGIPYALIEAEGGPMDTYAEWQLQDDEARRGAVAHFTWGQKQREILLGAGLYDENQIVVSGQPRFDFYFSPWRESLQDTGHEDHDDRPIILFTTKYISNQLSREAELASAKRRASNWRNVDVDEMMRQYDTSVESMKLFVPLAIDVAKRFPDARVVLRPHPYEKLDAYQPYIETAPPNIEINRERSVTDWLLSSVATVKLSCITAFEASFAGIPNFTPAWIPDGAPVPEAQHISIKMPSADSLCQAISECIAGTYESPDDVKNRITETVGGWFHLPDGNAHERIVDELLTRLSHMQPPNPQSRRRNSVAHLYGLAGKAALAPGAMKRKLIRATGIPPQFSFRKMGMQKAATLLSTKQADISLLDHYLNAAKVGFQRSGRPVPNVLLREADSKRDYIVTYNGNAVAIEPADQSAG